MSGVAELGLRFTEYLHRLIEDLVRPAQLESMYPNLAVSTEHVLVAFVAIDSRSGQFASLLKDYDAILRYPAVFDSPC
jgi:hypothetical protein